MKQTDCSDKGKNLYSFSSDNFSSDQSPPKEPNEPSKRNASLMEREMNAVFSPDKFLNFLPESLLENQKLNDKMCIDRENQDVLSKDIMNTALPMIKNGDGDGDGDDDSIELVDVSIDHFGNGMSSALSSAQENKTEYCILPLANLTTIYPTAWYHCSSSIISPKKDNTFDFEVRYNKTFPNEQYQVKSLSVHCEKHFTTNQIHRDTRKLRRIHALNGEPKRIIRRSTQKLNVVFASSINSQKQKKIN
jgi:hypothetical protein